MKVYPADQPSALPEAVELLKAGSLVAFPTDTVYGVAAHAFLPQAVARLYAAKERPRERAIPLLLSKVEDLPLVARDIPPLAWPLIERFWPGGLTLVLFRQATVPGIVSAGGETVAVRVPNHRLALALIEGTGAPLATSSANLSGRPEPVTADQVIQQLGARIDLILDGGPSPGGVPSTVVDLTLSPPSVLRKGAISVERLAELIPSLVLCNPRRVC
jgi:L-threonylcarbamoyladenylate synthase